MCLGDLLERISVDGKRLVFALLNPPQQLVHGLVQNLGAVEQKTQVKLIGVRARFLLIPILENNVL